MTRAAYIAEIRRHAARFAYGRERFADIEALALWPQHTRPLRRIHDPATGAQYARRKVHFLMDWLLSVQR